MHPLLTTLLLCGPPAPSDSWPGFRGDGTSTTTAANLPLNWSPTENVAWRAALPGYGQSSPVAWGGRVFVTAIDGPQKETLIVAALDAATGKPAWTKEFAATQKGKNNPMMSRAAPTPVVDAGGVVAFFESGDVLALNHDGAERWRRSLSNDYGAFKNNHGVGCSPAQTGRAVVILIDDLGPSYLVALDKLTGENLWKTERKSRSSWTSPVVAEFAGRPVVLVSSSGSLDAYDAATGVELATMPGLVGNTIPSPTPAAGGLVVVGAGENRMKPDPAGSARSNCCVRLTTSSEGKPAFEPVWQSQKTLSHHASPVVYRSHVYFVTKTGVVHCHDLATGWECYAERLDGQCWATPVGAGGRVYFFGKDGVTTVLAAGPEFEKLSVNCLWGAADAEARTAEAKKQATSTLPKSPSSDGGKGAKGPGGGPAMSKDELDAARYSAVGDVVYGVAAIEGAFFVRTGSELIRVSQGAKR